MSAPDVDRPRSKTREEGQQRRSRERRTVMMKNGNQTWRQFELRSSLLWRQVDCSGRRRQRTVRNNKNNKCIIVETSPKRASDINAASGTREFAKLTDYMRTFLPGLTTACFCSVETHLLAREQSRRRLHKAAKKSVENALENQRVSRLQLCCFAAHLTSGQQIATDASAMIKHYKALLHV